MNISKIYLPQGSTLLKSDIEEWKKKVSIYTDKFIALNKNYSPPDLFYLENLFSIDLLKFISENDCSSFATEMWFEHVKKIKDCFFEDPYKILTNDLIRYAIYLTCANEFLKTQIPYLKKYYEKNLMEDLLLENQGLYPTIVDWDFLTSESRVNHLTHLTYVEEALNIKIKDLNTIVEFGGGYGSMTDLIKRINNDVTHVVVDFPEMLLIQSYYLLGKYCADDINFITFDNMKIANEKINLLPINLSDKVEIGVVDLLIATWSLSEANEHTQKVIVEELKCFEARNILYGYRKYDVRNPRQPCSRPLDLAKDYYIIEDLPCFWTLRQENHYQLARKKYEDK